MPLTDSKSEKTELDLELTGTLKAIKERLERIEARPDSRPSDHQPPHSHTEGRHPLEATTEAGVKLSTLTAFLILDGHNTTSSIIAVAPELSEPTPLKGRISRDPTR
ncbi:hypothetical protein PoB_007328200 [Plakobranchus ocellatus]|uniref:Uncharacterized protein n=1 Tax=Plakobranchus ocellatus TaxID=259542 RepID=A0AAV4DRU4_9GAST|nr:hypothetical protein PoB_007328200 [Plakobranchus ocellatus]